MKLPIPFGNPRSYKGHSGVDFGQPRGTPIPASGPGKVSHRGRSTRGGCYIWVKYDNGPLAGYHHMDNHGGCPPDGARVVEGTRLGYVGSLGLFSTGPHLHSEISGEATTAGYWKYFDRNRVVGSRPAGGGGTPITPEPTQRRRQKEDDTMYVQHENKKYPQVYATFTDANGHLRLRIVKANEAAIALAGGLVIPVEDTTLTNLGIEAGWSAGRIVMPLPKVDVTVPASTISDAAIDSIAVKTAAKINTTTDLKPVLDAVAAIKLPTSGTITLN